MKQSSLQSQSSGCAKTPILTVVMHGQHFQQSRDQPGMVANPARGQLIRENAFVPSNLARWVRPSRPASAPSFSPLRLNLVLTNHGIPPAFRDDVVHIYIIHRQPPSGQSRVNRVIMCLGVL